MSANVVNGMVFPYQYELMGSRRERTVARVEGVENVLRIGVAATAGLLGSFAIPAGFLCLGFVRWIGYVSALTQHYRRARAGRRSENEEELFTKPVA